MHQTIMAAMQALGDAGLIFGSTNSQKGEHEFQGELGRTLARMTEDDGWTWRHSHHGMEEVFETSALPNEETIAIDLVGRHEKEGLVAIELKLALDPYPDPPAFPYTVAKDCLKLDLLRAGRCKPTKRSSPLPDQLHTYAIALTDCAYYWESEKRSAWGRDFVDRLRVAPICLEGLIKTKGGNPANTIFNGKRCHIAFGQAWHGQWHHYSSETPADRLRFLLLQPRPKTAPVWTHDQKSITEQSAIIPFLNDASRQEFQRQNREWKSRKKAGSPLVI